MEENTQNTDQMKALEEVKQKILKHPGVQQAREQYIIKVTTRLEEVLKLHFDEQENREKFNKITKEIRAYIEELHT